MPQCYPFITEIESHLSLTISKGSREAQMCISCHAGIANNKKSDQLASTDHWSTAHSQRAAMTDSEHSNQMRITWLEIISSGKRKFLIKPVLTSNQGCFIRVEEFRSQFIRNKLFRCLYYSNIFLKTMIDNYVVTMYNYVDGILWNVLILSRIL